MNFGFLEIISSRWFDMYHLHPLTVLRDNGMHARFGERRLTPINSGGIR